jgi:hypothetical protein
MGGNIVDSMPGSWVGCAGTLLGPEGAAVWLCSSVPGSGPALYRSHGLCGVWWWPYGFGVRWGVCELDSGCEHLN